MFLFFSIQQVSCWNIQQPSLTSSTPLIASDPSKFGCGFSAAFNADGFVSEFEIEWCDQDTSSPGIRNGDCASGQLINGLGIKSDDTSSVYNRINQIRVYCKEKEGDGTGRGDFTSGGGHGITSLTAEYIESEIDKFVCGFKTQRVNEIGGVDGGGNKWFIEGITGFDITLCEVSCENRIIPKVLSQAILDQTILAVDGMTNSFSIADYLENLNPLTCPLLSCQTYHVEDDSETNPAEISVRNNLDIVINTNIELDRNVILKCQNKAQNAVSQQFQVKVTCQTQQIDLPDGFQDQQVPVPECTTDAAQKAKFVFSQFKTQFSGCPMKEYKVYLSQTVQNVPYGLDVTNPISVGSQSTFEIPVANWENPSLFTFVILGCDFQANCLFTSELTLQVKCPNPVAFNLVPSQYLTAMSTFVGAEGSQARYTFSASVSTLPRCNEIQFYEIIDVSPPGAITYPSESCSTDPCLVIDLDVRTEGTISFKVKPVDSTGLLPASDMITVTVSKDAQSPEIINFNQGQDQDQQFEPHSNKMFSFSPFQCTTGCTITNYQVFESGTSQNSVSGLGQPTFNSVNGKMEISVDTSALKTFQFVVKAEVENIPTIFAITNQLSAAVQCGSEIISVSQSQVPLDPFERASSIFSYTGFRAIFQSSVSECGLTTFELFTTSSLVTPWSDSSISFDQAQNLVIDQSVPQKQSVFIKGSSSSGAYNVLEVQIIVCGKEEITSLPEDQIYLFGSKVQEIDFQQYFETSYSQTNSDLKCTQIKQYSIVECEPSDDTSKFTISGQKIKIETSIPFKQNLCVQAQTLGQKTATHIQEIEIDFCGLEEISLEGASEQISKVFALNKKIHEIDFKEEGFSFSSSLPNCPATRFRILNEDLSVYTGSILELDSYKIKVQTLSPLQEVYYLEASSDEGKTNTELKIYLTICGFENITALQNDKTEVKLPASLVLHTLSNDIRKLFMHIGNSLCPIISYTIMQKNITEVVKFDGNQLQIYPKKAEENEFKITIKAQSLGYKTADFIYKIILLKVDEATLNQINNNQNKTETLSEDTDYKSLMDASFQEQITKNLPYYVKFSVFDCQNNDVTDTDQIIVYKVTSKYIGKDEEEKEIYFETILHFGCDLPAFVNEARGFFDPNKPGELLRRVKCFVRGTALEEIFVKRKKLGKLVPTFTYLVNLYDNQIKFQVQVGIETESICNSVPGIQQIMEHESDHKTLENYQMINEVGDKVVQNINNNLEFKNQQKDLEKAITYSKPKIRSVKVKQEDYILTFSINFSNQMNFQGQQTCDFFNVTIISPYKSKTMQGFCSNNKTRFLSNDESFQISFVESDEKSISFLLVIKNSTAISEQNPYQLRDYIQLQMLPNDLLVDIHNQTFDEETFQIKGRAEIPPVIQDDLSNQMIAVASQTLFSIGAGALIQTILKSGSTQQVWGLISSSQIVIHMMLLKFSVTAPDNIVNYNSFLSTMVQHDMYPMDNINEKVFKFTETESPIEQFEDLGYEGKNFIMLTGSMIINIITIFGVGLAGYITNIIVRRFNRFFYIRKLGMSIENTLKNPVTEVLNYYMASFMEIFFCVIISLLGPEYYSWSDRFSLILCIVSCFILMILPILIGTAIQKNLDEYQFMHEEFSHKHFLSSYFNLIIIVRKALFVLILVLAHDIGSLQIIMHMMVTMAFACILFHIKPYLDKSEQNQNCANEIIIWVSSLILQVLANTDYNRKFLALSYVVISSSNMVYSLYCMLQETFKKTIPQSWAKFKKYREDVKYRNWIQNRWLKTKENFAKDHPEDEVAQKVWAHAKLIVKIKDLQEKLQNLDNEYQSHLQWLLKNELRTHVLKDQELEIKKLRDQIKADEDQCENENNDFGIIMGNSFGGVRQLKFSENTVGRRRYTFPYMNQEPPNSEELLISNVIEPFLIQHKISSLDSFDRIQQNALSEQIKAFNSDCLQKFIERINLQTVEIIGDGNCAPRAIAAAIYANQEQHARVRREVCQYLRVNYKYWGKQSDQKHYDQFIDHTLSKNGEWFSDTELKAAAKLYNRAIIIFSSQNPTPFFDMIQLAMTHEGNNMEPIYLHHVNSNHFNLLTSSTKISLQNIVDVKIKKKIFMKGEKTRKLETIIEQ